MIYFKHKNTGITYKAATLRNKLVDHHCFMFDAIIASIVYGNIDTIWSDSNAVIRFIDDYEVLIPYHNVFGVKAGEVIVTAI